MKPCSGCGAGILPKTSELYDGKCTICAAPKFDWPTVGSVHSDAKVIGRNLTITAINKRCPLDRNIVGTVNGEPYACCAKTFQVIWRPAVSS